MFNKYCDEIEKLKGFAKEDILDKKFELFSGNNMKIYYAPHNEIINERAKILIVGITPGWTQTSIAYKTAHEGLVERLDYGEIKKECKRHSRFAGSMRKNLIEMLDELNLNSKLHIDSCLELFENKDELLHTTSMLPYPVFIKNKNYTGFGPKTLDNEILKSYLEKYFYKEIEKLPNVFIIPLGKAVDEVLESMISKNLIRKEQCLLGFPHPSGANGHRKMQFKENKEDLLNIINKYFNQGGNNDGQ